MEKYGARAKSQINSMKLQGNEKYFKCELVWHDDESASIETIKIGKEIEINEEDDVFCYVSSISALKSLMDWENGKGFTINDIIEIY